MKLLHVAGRRIVLARTEDGYRACDDRCTHKGGPLSDGVLACGTVQCPWHGSQFSVKSGQVKAGPAEKPIQTYRVTEENGKVQLKIPDDK
jgi:nitrite reductase/ring-hydroxylating ferredoxin subunit